MTNWIHLCIDMQRMFAEETPWHVPWMADVSDEVIELASRFPTRTVFTRFVPPPTAEDVPGMWKDYYTKWNEMTGERLNPSLVDLVPELKRFVPPARIFDKRTYSPWFGSGLHRALSEQGVSELVITGGETDVCVLAAALGAIDLGYKVVIAKDAVCSGVDATHDASLELLDGRFSVQVEITSTEALLSRR